MLNKKCTINKFYFRNKSSLTNSRNFTIVMKSLADVGIDSVFVSQPRLTGAEVAIIRQTTNIEKIFDRLLLNFHV